MNIFEIKKSLTKNNPSLKFKTTTKKMSNMLRVSPYMVRKCIEALQQDGFLICNNKPRSIGRGKWTPWELEIINPLKKEDCKVVVVKAKQSVCENCIHASKLAYYSRKDELGIKTNYKSFWCDFYTVRMPYLEECKCKRN